MNAKLIVKNIINAYNFMKVIGDDGNPIPQSSYYRTIRHSSGTYQLRVSDHNTYLWTWVKHDDDDSSPSSTNIAVTFSDNPSAPDDENSRLTGWKAQSKPFTVTQYVYDSTKLSIDDIRGIIHSIGRIYEGGKPFVDVLKDGNHSNQATVYEFSPNSAPKLISRYRDVFREGFDKGDVIRLVNQNDAAIPKLKGSQFFYEINGKQEEFRYYPETDTVRHVVERKVQDRDIPVHESVSGSGVNTKTNETDMHLYRNDRKYALTENQITKIVKESLKRVLNEYADSNRLVLGGSYTEDGVYEIVDGDKIEMYHDSLSQFGWFNDIRMYYSPDKTYCLLRRCDTGKYFYAMIVPAPELGKKETKFEAVPHKSVPLSIRRDSQCLLHL